ncbi:MAG TPA: hypothetical protein VHH33_09050 [Nitrososphaeraceae archaeon]|jgi:hypothetical protein|nr:hypothetical protein [Nitrososphaeraceae archaeon]
MILPKGQNLLIAFVPARPVITRSHQNVLKPIAVVAKRLIILWFWMEWKDL